MGVISEGGKPTRRGITAGVGMSIDGKRSGAGKAHRPSLASFGWAHWKKRRRTKGAKIMSHVRRLERAKRDHPGGKSDEELIAEYMARWYPKG